MRWLVKLLREKSKIQNEALGKLLRKARDEAGLTQVQAAAHVGHDQTFVAKVESGCQQATFVEVEQLARAYGKRLPDFQTIDEIELRFRRFAIRSDWPRMQTEDFLAKQERRRRQKRKDLRGRRRQIRKWKKT